MAAGVQVKGPTMICGYRIYRETGGGEWSCVANTSESPGPLGVEYEVQFHGNVREVGRGGTGVFTTRPPLSIESPAVKLAHVVLLGGNNAAGTIEVVRDRPARVLRYATAFDETPCRRAYIVTMRGSTVLARRTVSFRDLESIFDNRPTSLSASLTEYEFPKIGTCYNCSQSGSFIYRSDRVDSQTQTDASVHRADKATQTVAEPGTSDATGQEKPGQEKTKKIKEEKKTPQLLTIRNFLLGAIFLTLAANLKWPRPPI